MHIYLLYPKPVISDESASHVSDCTLRGSLALRTCSVITWELHKQNGEVRSQF